MIERWCQWANEVFFFSVDPRRYAALRVVFGLIAAVRVYELWQIQSSVGDEIGWLYSGVAASAVFMIAGCFSRASTFLVYLGFAAFRHFQPWFLNSGDSTIAFTCFFLSLSRCGESWSVDEIRRARPPRAAEAWPLRMLQFQVCMIYFVAGASKLVRRDWFNPDALSYVLASPIFSRWDLSFLRDYPAIVDAIGWLSLTIPIWEVAFAVLVLFRPCRTWILASGVVFHVGLIVFMKLQWFGQVMIASYLIFLPLPVLLRLFPPGPRASGSK